MGDAVIRVETLSKRFQIGKRKGNSSIREALGDVIRAPFRKRTGEDEETTLWALRDLSFQVGEGEVVGLVGRNGAGKSTLLKILARVTRPTSGWAKVTGRIGSLLEVGTGFHHELTGRENVFLSGAVLGMKKAEIVRRFDEIVAFSEVERFLDTPLKHYSSGMQMRLAFAVAAHLEPEILLVDEVLAVGDASFQRKCLGKIKDVASRGRTILFVSHTMAAVSALCSRALLLERGQIAFEGPTSDVTARYYARNLGKVGTGGDLTDVPRIGTGKARFTSVSIRAVSKDGRVLAVAEAGCDLIVETSLEAHAAIPDSNVAVIIYDSSGYRLVDVNLNQRGEFLRLRPGERASVRFVLRDLLLKPGLFFVGLWIGRDNIEHIDGVENAATLDVAPPATQLHSVVFPGPYLCRFESSISVFEAPNTDGQDRSVMSCAASEHEQGADRA